jgi:hypothetical protein
MDAGSLLLLRPNIGMEHRKGQYSFSWLAMYKTNQSYWLNEYTGLANAKGLRTDFSIRRYSKTIPAFYTEAQVRLQYVKSDSLEHQKRRRTWFKNWDEFSKGEKVQFRFKLWLRRYLL